MSMVQGHLVTYCAPMPLHISRYRPKSMFSLFRKRCQRHGVKCSCREPGSGLAQGQSLVIRLSRQIGWALSHAQRSAIEHRTALRWRVWKSCRVVRVAGGRCIRGRHVVCAIIDTDLPRSCQRVTRSWRHWASPFTWALTTPQTRQTFSKNC